MLSHYVIFIINFFMLLADRYINACVSSFSQSTLFIWMYVLRSYSSLYFLFLFLCWGLVRCSLQLISDCFSFVAKFSFQVFRAIWMVQTFNKIMPWLFNFAHHCISPHLQVLEREQTMNKFLEVTARLEQTLSGISYEELDISDEVKEQVYIHHLNNPDIRRR